MEANQPPALAAPTETPTAPDEPAPHQAAPDWASARDLHCPLCDYNLRGLSDPRCPECGYRFEWAELLDEKLKVHPYLFEHHPERNVWSFVRTLAGGLRPARFWQALHPGQAVRPRRLSLYWAIVMAVSGVAAAGTTLVVGCVLEKARQRYYLNAWGAHRSPFIGMGGQTLYMWPDGRARPTPPPVPGHFDRHGWEKAWKQFGKYYAVGWAAACAWPWATLLTLMIFQASMRRAKVRPGHVRRCVLYSLDVVLWGTLFVAGWHAMLLARWMRGGVLNFNMDHAAVVYALPLLAALVTYRLGRAYSRYVQFDQPWATVIASQVIVTLAGLIVLFNLSSSRLIMNLMELL